MKKSKVEKVSLPGKYLCQKRNFLIGTSRALFLLTCAKNVNSCIWHTLLYTCAKNIKSCIWHMTKYLCQKHIPKGIYSVAQVPSSRMLCAVVR